MVKFPEEFEENYIDEESGKFVKEMLPLLKELYYRQDTDTIVSLQKKFFDKVEEKITQEILHWEKWKLVILGFYSGFFYINQYSSTKKQFC